MPGTAELCSMFGGLNHQTIRQAVGVLREANLVEAIPGKGTFVKTAVEHRHVALVLPNFEDEVQVTIAAGVRDFFKETSIRAVLRSPSIAVPTRSSMWRRRFKASSRD